MADPPARASWRASLSRVRASLRQRVLRLTGDGSEADGEDDEGEHAAAGAARALGPQTMRVGALRELWEAIKDGSAPLDAKGTRTAASVAEEKRLGWKVNQALALRAYSAADESAKNAALVLYSRKMRMETFVEILSRELPENAAITAQALDPSLRRPFPPRPALLLFSSFHDTAPFHDEETIECLHRANQLTMELLYGESSIEQALREGHVDDLISAVRSLETIWHDRVVDLDKCEQVLQRLRECWMVHVETAVEEARMDQDTDKLGFARLLCNAGRIMALLEPSNPDAVAKSYLLRAREMITKMCSDDEVMPMEFVDANVALGAFYAAQFKSDAREAYNAGLAALEARIDQPNSLGSQEERQERELLAAYTLEAARAAARYCDVRTQQSLCEKAVALFEQTFPSTYLGTLAARHERGRAEYLLARHEDAVDTLWMVCEDLRETQADPTRRAYVFHDLANVYRSLANWEQAGIMTDRAMACLDEADATHQSAILRAEILVMESRVLLETGRYMDAQERGKQALEQMSKNVCRDDPMLWSPGLFLGEAHLRLFDFSNGMKCMETAMEILSKSAGDSHLWMTEIRCHYARALGHVEVQRVSDGQTMLRNCQNALIGCGISEEHPWIGAVQGLRGQLERDFGLLNTGLVKLQAHFGKKHFRTTGVLLDAPNFQSDEERFRTYALIVEIMEDSMPHRHHAYLGIALSNMGLYYKNKCEFAAARDLFQSAYENFAGVYPPAHKNLTTVRDLLTDMQNRARYR